MNAVQRPTRRGANAHMAAFDRHVGCDPRTMTYPEGDQGVARCGSCGAAWVLDLRHGGYRFVGGA